MKSERNLGRRSFLRRVTGSTGGAVATAFLPVVDVTPDPQRTYVTVRELGGAKIRYELHVSGDDLQSQGFDESNDDIAARSATGTLLDDEDGYSFSGQILSFSVNAVNANASGYQGRVELTADSGSSTTEESSIDISSSHGTFDFNMSYCEFQVADGNVSSLNDGSLEFEDETREQTARSYLSGGHDRFDVTGWLERIYIRTDGHDVQLVR
jgi:hypothetical protein